MAFKNHESGFTFVSMLLTLVIILVTLPLIIFLLSEIKNEQKEEHISAHQFFIFLHHDTLLANKVYVNDNILHFELNASETAVVEHYRDVIRRRVDGKGHEIYIREIQEFTLTPLDYGFQVKIMMNNGEEYEKTIAFNN